MNAPTRTHINAEPHDTAGLSSHVIWLFNEPQENVRVTLLGVTAGTYCIGVLGIQGLKSFFFFSLQ